MPTVRATKNQTVFDACIWVYGTITKLNDFLLENDFKADEEISQGQILNYTSDQGNERIKSKYTREEIIPSSFNFEELTGFRFMDGDLFRFMDGQIFEFMNF